MQLGLRSYLLSIRLRYLIPMYLNTLEVMYITLPVTV